MTREDAIVTKLNEVAMLNADLSAKEDAKNAKIDKIYTPTIRAKVEAVTAKFDEETKAIKDRIEELSKEIKDDTLLVGATVKGEYMMAVWNKARVTWDGKGLDGYAVAHPEINAFRNEGEPSITIRKR